MSLTDLFDGATRKLRQFAWITSTVLTVGGNMAIEQKLSAMERRKRELDNSIALFRFAEKQLKSEIELLGVETAACVSLLQEARDYAHRISCDNIRSVAAGLAETTTPQLAVVEEAISSFRTAVAAGKGAGIGMAASTGAWTLATHLGSASSSAGFASLSSLETHKALLSWLGGGVLAAGGGDLTLGAFVLSGISAISAVTYGAYKSYTQAAAIERRTKEIAEKALINRDSVKKMKRMSMEMVNLRAVRAARRQRFFEEYRDIRVQVRHLAMDLAQKATAFEGSLHGIQKQLPRRCS